MFATPPSLANPRRRQAPSSSLARCPPSPHPRGRTRSKAPPPRASPPDPRHSAAFFSSLPHPRSESEILLLGSGGGSCTRRRSIQRIGRRKPDPEGETPSLSLSLEEDVAACALYKDPLRQFLVRLVSSYRYGGDHVDEELARAEAAELHGAVVSKKEALHGDVVRIVSSRSKPQLRATFQRYKQDHARARQPAMAMFKNIATQQLGLLWYIFMVGAVSVLPGAIPANACGTELLYQRVVLANYFLVRATLAAAVLLLTVKICVGAAEDSAITAACAAAAGDKAFDAEAGTRAAGHKARDEAVVEGLGCITAKWKRVLLRGMLLLAVALSAAASFLAIVIFEDWCQYGSGCNAGYGLGSPVSVLMMVVTTLVHGHFAWVAVCKN